MFAFDYAYIIRKGEGVLSVTHCTMWLSYSTPSDYHPTCTIFRPTPCDHSLTVEW